MPASTFVSAHKRQTNRLNAARSTGPKTARGKRSSRRNATTHGIFCEDAVIAGEDGELFAQLRRAMLESYLPQNVAELALVERIGLCQWKLRRCESAEMWYYENGIQCLQEKHQRRALRLAEKQVDEEAHELDEQEEEQLRQKLEAQAREEVAEFWQLEQSPAAAMVMGQDLARPATESVLERFQRYAQRLENTIARCHRELQRLRKMNKELAEGAECPFLTRQTEEPDEHEHDQEKEEEQEQEQEQDQDEEQAGAGEAMRQNETSTANLQNEAKVKLGKVAERSAGEAQDEKEGHATFSHVAGAAS